MALEVEAGSLPLRIRKKQMARKEVVKALEMNLPIASRLEGLLDVLDVQGLTFLEMNAVEMPQVVKSICKTKLSGMPPNIRVSMTLGDEMKKRELNA